MNLKSKILDQEIFKKSKIRRIYNICVFIWKYFLWKYEKIEIFQEKNGDELLFIVGFWM